MSKVRQRKGGKKAQDDEDIIKPEEKEMHRARIKKWMEKEESALRAERASQKMKNEESSDAALKIVLLVWFLIVLGIFYHVFNTIYQGRSASKHNAEIVSPFN